MFYGMNAWFLASLVMGAHLLVVVAVPPMLRGLAPELAARIFVAGWARSAPVLTVGTAAAVALGVLASMSEPDMKWAVGAAFLAGSLLFSALVTHPLASRLRALGEATVASDAPPLLLRWRRLHLVRATLVAVGVFFFIWAAH